MRAFSTSDPNVYLDREGEGLLDKRACLRSFLVVLIHVFEFRMFTKRKKVALVVRSKENVHFLCSSAPPPFVYLGRHRCHSRDKMDQASPILHTASNQNWRSKLDSGKAWERGLGTLLSSSRQEGRKSSLHALFVDVLLPWESPRIRILHIAE